MAFKPFYSAICISNICSKKSIIKCFENNLPIYQCIMQSPMSLFIHQRTIVLDVKNGSVKN